MEELYSRNSTSKNKGSSDRSFGFVFTVFFIIVALYPLAKGGNIRWWAFACSSIFLFFALVAPTVLGPANRLWAKFGDLLHRIVSPVALGVMFYLVIAPIGILLRLFGKDLLKLRPDPTTESYWVKRTPPGPAADSFNNQF